MPLTKKQYISKYVGKVDKRRTNAYRKRGNKLSKINKSVKKYAGLSMIKHGSDTTGYIINTSIHAAKSRMDRKRSNKTEGWEKKNNFF